MQTPDVTKAQWLAFLTPIFAFLAAFGIFDLTEAQQLAIVGLSGSLSVAITLADALIRRGRAKVAAAEIAIAPAVAIENEKDVARGKKDVAK